MSFDPLGDFETRGYLRNVFAEKNPAIVKRQEHHAFRLHVGEALDALGVRPSLTYQDILDTHQRLFGDYYPWAGQDRLAILPDLAVGKAGRYDLFAHPYDVRRAAEYGLEIAQQRGAMRDKPGEIMGLLAHAHPFLDGNGRTIMAVHADLALRAGVHIEWEHINKGPYLSALTQELTEPGKGHLDSLLRPYVRPGARPLTEATAALSSHAGLGPPAVEASAAAPVPSASERDGPASESKRPLARRSGPSPGGWG